MQYFYYILDIDNILTIVVAFGAFLTFKSILSSFMYRDVLAERMQVLADERNVLRDRNQEALGKVALRQGDGNIHVKDVVEIAQLDKIVDSNKIREKLNMAGYRKQSSVFTFLFARLIMPVVMLICTAFYLMVWSNSSVSVSKFIFLLGASAVFGFFVPGIMLNNMVAKRQQEIKSFFADALDLLLICVEAGMSLEAALRKVAKEIGNESIVLAEELYLTTAELSYLPHRRQAYLNLAKRTGLDEVKALTTMLIQSEKYGTSLAQSLSVLGDENRRMNMLVIEKKAAGLSPKLTVPMIVFFLPVLFVVVLGPAIIQASKTMAGSW